MTALRSTHVEVYLFRRRGTRVEFLALRRAPERKKLPGVWQPVTGGRRRLESPLRAAAREVFEETGLRPKRWWMLETLTLYADAKSGAVLALPLFAAEVGARERVTLSEEHDGAEWLTERRAARRFLWESQRRGLAAVRREVLDNPTLARAIDVTAAMGGRAARSQAATRRRRKAAARKPPPREQR